MTLDPPSPAPCRSSGCWRNIAGHKDFASLVRIGVHAATAIRRGQDYSGKEVHKAARIAALAERGEILATSDTVADAGEGIAGSDAREVTLRGVAEPVEIARVEWR